MEEKSVVDSRVSWWYSHFPLLTTHKTLYLDGWREDRLSILGVDHPLVSIITPVLNGIKYLELCLNSVLNQTYPYIEHIIVDGGSTDGTLEILARYQAKYPQRIRFISESDKNPEEAWNKGLTVARGEILGWLGADDFYEPDAIQTVVSFFRANPDAYFVFGGENIIDEKGWLIESIIPKNDFDLKEAINDKYEVAAHSSFYRHEVIEKVGLIDSSSRMSEFDYWVRVGKVYRIYRLEKILSNFRVHPTSFSGSLVAARVFYPEGFKISRRYGGSIFSPRARRYYRFVILNRLGLYPVVNKLYAVWSRVQKRRKT